MNNKFGLRLLGAIVLLLAISAIAFLAFNIGVNYSSTTAAVQVPQHTVFYFPPLFGAGGFFLVLFLVFALSGAMRLVFWGGRPWRRHYRMMDSDFVPPMFEEWHRRAHESTKPPAE